MNELAEDDEKSGEIRADRIIGEVLANRYQIEVWLGEGAMGSVYKARHVKVGRAFAVKILHKKLLEDRKVTQRFEREAELAGRLRHPNVVGVVDVGETTDGFRYMVMDFAEGLDLATLLGEAPMPAERIIHLTRQMLEGLYHAHEAGLIHRDFKPENVIVERDDHDTEVPRIVDFGIAILREGGDSVNSAGRLTTNGLVLGTPHYMAPEQAVADPIDHRIDLFALGIVVYEMLCGRLPFDGTGAEVARANLLLDPPLIALRVPYLEVDPLLEAFARRLMAKKREQRPATAKAARELLDLISNDRSAAAAALGVPLAASSRQPATTQPVTPHAVAHEDDPDSDEVSYSGSIPEGVAHAKSSPSLRAAVLEAPPVQNPVFATASSRSQYYISTDDATPLRSKRRTWVLAGLGAFSVAAIATVIVLKARGGAQDSPALPEPTTVVVHATGPEPAPPPATDTKPVIEPPAQPAPTPDVVKKPAVKKPKIIATKPTLPQVKPEKKPETKPEIKPETKPDPPKPTVIDAGALVALYAAVGRDFKIVAELRGPSAIATLEPLYRRIQIQQASSSEARRAETAATLNSLRAQLAPLKQKP